MPFRRPATDDPAVRADKRAARVLGPAGGEAIASAVVLHGFTGATWDVLPVASALATAGARVQLPVLRGHDAGIEALRGAGVADWRADVDAAIDQARAATEGPVFLAGLSMGALLALDAAIRRPEDVRGVASLAAPLELSAAARGLAHVASQSRSAALRQLVWPKLGGSDISTREPLPGPTGVPAMALAQLLRLIKEVRAGLPSVRTPLLVLHARDDHTAPVWGAYAIASQAMATPLRLVVLDDGFHVITRDTCRKRVAREVTSWLRRQVTGQAPDNQPGPFWAPGPKTSALFRLRLPICPR